MTSKYADWSPLEAIEHAIALQHLPPVNEWRPSVTRDVDIRIARDGQWFYRESPILRERMVKLFSSVLQVADDGETYLVSPQERLRISVDDAPFFAGLVELHGAPNAATLVFTTNVGDRVVADDAHPVKVVYATPGSHPAPYVLVRDRLWALIGRAAFYQLCDWAEVRQGVIGVESAGQFIQLGEAEP